MLRLWCGRPEFTSDGESYLVVKPQIRYRKLEREVIGIRSLCRIDGGRGGGEGGGGYLFLQRNRLPILRSWVSV